jgi:hypothetical protein
LVRIADVFVRPVGSQVGSLQLFANIFSNGCYLTNGTKWSVEELFASIAEIRQEFLMCYPNVPSLTIPVQKVKTETGFYERVSLKDLERFTSIEDVLAKITDFKASYITPQYNDQSKFLILRPKLGSPGLGQFSLFGDQFIRLAHVKNNQELTPSTLILMMMSLYALGFLSRYKPELWNPFIKGDTSGEILLVFKLLAICQRYIPNLILDEIHQQRHRFVNHLEDILDQPLLSDMTQLRKVVDEQLKKNLGKEGFSSES